MGTDDTSIGGTGAGAPDPAPAAFPDPVSSAPVSAAPPPYAPAPQPPAPASRSRLGRIVGIGVCVAAVAVATGAVVAYGQATDDKRDAERELVKAERDLADETARADAAEAEVDAQTTRADDAEAEVERLGGDLEDKDAELADRDEQLEDYRSGTVDFLALSAEFGLGASTSDAQCIAEAFVADRGAETLSELVKSFSGVSNSVDTGLVEYADACGVDPDTLVPAGIEPGFAYGDNPTLDALYDACADGDGQACDDLFLSSEADSEYEAFGLTCGERFELGSVPETCVGAI